MVKLDKIYTKGGDKGFTSIVGGQRLKKSDSLIEAIGSVDELNALLGVIICYLNKSQKAIMRNIQNNLFDLGADLATPMSKKKNALRINSIHTLNLEKEIDKINSKLSTLKSFILPGGSKVSSLLHLARTVNRRCEINIVKVKNEKEINLEVLKYINRLSDFLFVLARKSNKNEILWKPLKKIINK